MAVATPNIKIPIADSTGNITPAWFRFFLDFYRDTTAFVSGSGYVVKTATGTTVREIASSSDFTITNPAGLAGNTSISLNTTAVTAGSYGLSAFTVDSRGRITAATQRTLVAPAAGISISNGTGVSGNPTLSLSDDLAAVESLSTTGLVKRTASNTWSTIPVSQTVIQSIYQQTGATASGTTLLPIDDTIPQNTEGDEYLTQNFTPLSASSVLRIDVVLYLSSTDANSMAVCLFKDTDADALATGQVTVPGADFTVAVPLTYFVSSGSASARTYKIRAGGAAAGTTRLNGRSGARLFGGTYNSYISITEYL